MPKRTDLRSILVVGAVLAVEGDRISGGTWVSFFVYVIVLVGPAQSLGQLLALAEGARAALDRVARVLSEAVGSDHSFQRSSCNQQDHAMRGEGFTMRTCIVASCF